MPGVRLYRFAPMNAKDVALTARAARRRESLRKAFAFLCPAPRCLEGKNPHLQKEFSCNKIQQQPLE